MHISCRIMKALVCLPNKSFRFFLFWCPTRKNAANAMTKPFLSNEYSLPKNIKYEKNCTNRARVIISNTPRFHLRA